MMGGLARNRKVGRGRGARQQLGCRGDGCVTELEIQAALCRWRSDSPGSGVTAWTGSGGLARVQSPPLLQWWGAVERFWVATHPFFMAFRFNFLFDYDL